MYVSKARIRSALATVLPTGWFEEMKMIWLISVATINVFSKILSRFCNISVKIDKHIGIQDLIIHKIRSNSIS